MAKNPAYTGSRDALTATSIYRDQWVGFEGAPKTLSFSIHSPILKQNSGLGLAVIRDKIGIQDNMHVNISYAYRIDFEIGRLAMGLNTQINRLQMRWSDTSPLQQQDLAIPYSNNDMFYVNFGTGIYFDTERFYVGLSVPKLLENKLDFMQNDAESYSLAKQKRHYFAMAGGMFDINEDIKLHPAFLIKYVDNSPVEADLNLSMFFYDTFLFGTTFRTGDSFDIIGQIRLKNGLTIGYAHDFTFTRLNLHHKGTHEILLSYDFKLRSSGFDHPRYF